MHRDWFKVRTALSRSLSACALALGFWRACATAQDLRYVSHQAWSTEEGLPQSSVHSILQTRDGYLWVATEAGLARFDGAAFRVFDRNSDAAFRSDDICCLAEQDGLWAGTSDGLLRLDHGAFRRYGSADGLPSDSVVSIVVAPSGTLLVDTTGGWARWAEQQFQAQRFQALSTAPSVAAGVVGAWRFTAQSVAVGTHEWRVGRELPAGRVTAFAVDREGVGWIGMNNGLVLARADDASLTPVAALHGNAVLSLFEDAEGNHWIGTETSGLHVLRTLKFRGEPALAATAVTSVAQTSDGAIWVGTREDGLRRLRNGVWEQPVAEHALTSSVILALATDARGGLWAGTPDGLDYIPATGPVQRITSVDGLPDDSIRSLAASPDGSVWAGTRRGLVHLHIAEGKPSIDTLATGNGLGGDLIGAVLLGAGQGAGELWAGTSGGLSRVRGDGQITNYTMKNGLPGMIVTAMAQDEAGKIWVATQNGGLSFFDGRRFVSIANFDRVAAHDNNIEAMVADHAGSLWLRMDRGVRSLPVAAVNACAAPAPCTLPDDSISSYGLTDGIPNDEVVPGVASMASLASNGEIWFPSRGGVAIVDTQHLPANAVAPPVVVQRFLVDDTAQPLGETPIEIPFGNSRLTIEYAGLSFLAPSSVRYRFLMENFDDHWTDAGNRRLATYTNLPPGRYRFRVEARNNDGVWNHVGASVSFRVIPPVYRRWWFIALALLALVAALYGLYLLRLRWLRRQFDAVLAERNRMAREIHDTLTQDFVGTSLQLDILAYHLKSGQVDKAMAQVRQTRQLVTDGLEEARRSIWELRANNSQDSLPTRLRTLLQRDTYAGISPQLKIGGAYRPLDPRMERELLRIAQEALANVVHHAQAAETTVELLYFSDSVSLAIRDNGIGFSVEDGSHKEGHFGLLGMKERAATLDGQLEVSSEPGRGTNVTLRVPLGSTTKQTR
jgi:signal transduction histidine kinase/ligand-binding sensor domain-containing protein